MQRNRNRAKNQMSKKDKGNKKSDTISILKISQLTGDGVSHGHSTATKLLIVNTNKLPLNQQVCPLLISVIVKYSKNPQNCSPMPKFCSNINAPCGSKTKGKIWPNLSLDYLMEIKFLDWPVKRTILTEQRFVRVCSVDLLLRF